MPMFFASLSLFCFLHWYAQFLNVTRYNLGSRLKYRMKCLWENRILKDGKRNSLEIVHCRHVSFLLRSFSSVVKLGFQDSLSRHIACAYKCKNCLGNMISRRTSTVVPFIINLSLFVRFNKLFRFFVGLDRKNFLGGDHSNRATPTDVNRETEN